MTTAKLKRFMSHPLELAFCGYSGSGKTTLITAVMSQLSFQFKIGYVKSDVHGFEIDHKGKDTHTALKSGASAVFISDSDHWATVQTGSHDLLTLPSLYENCDFVLAEGYKNSSMDKIVILDEDQSILKSYSSGQLDSIVAFVGISPERPNGLLVDIPYFQRDAIGHISEFVKTYFLNQVSKRPLYGLVLTGGKSLRMKQDKALLKYSHKTQTEVSLDLLESKCEKVYVSSRKGQWKGDHQWSHPSIEDKYDSAGPLSGILSAMDQHPEAAWLVVACDLPFLDNLTIDQLVSERNKFKMATAFQSSVSELPEPLCAIYEPRFKPRLLHFLGLDYACPRKILIHSSHKTLVLKNKNALSNANFPDEYKQAREQIERSLV